MHEIESYIGRCEYGADEIECVWWNGYRCLCFCPTQENQSGLDKKREREKSKNSKESPFEGVAPFQLCWF